MKCWIVLVIGSLGLLLNTHGVLTQDFDIAQSASIASAVVQLQVQSSAGRAERGSGVLVSPNGIIFTNAHIVRDALEIEVAMVSGYGEQPTPRYRARTLNRMEVDGLDFAMLEIYADDNGQDIDPDNLNLPYLNVDNIEVSISLSVYIVSFQQLGAGTVSMMPGAITTKIPRKMGNDNSYTVYQTDANFSDGGSGGAVINQSGRLIGVAWEFSPDPIAFSQLATFIPISTICEYEPAACLIADDQTVLPPITITDPMAGNSGVKLRGAVNANVLNIRNGPGPEYGEVAQLHNGDQVTAIGRNQEGTWIQIQGIGERWVNARYINFTSGSNTSQLPITYREVGDWAPAGASTGVQATATDVLRLRGGPGENYRQLENPDTLRHGQTADVVGKSRDGQWLLINIGPRSAWIKSEFTTLSGSMNQLPILN